jgi:hypothetical protein
MHNYYHLVPLICCYCSVSNLSDSLDYSSSSWHKCFIDIGVFHCILLAGGKTFGFTHGWGVWV